MKTATRALQGLFNWVLCLGLVACAWGTQPPPPGINLLSNPTFDAHANGTSPVSPAQGWIANPAIFRRKPDGVGAVGPS